MARRQGDTGSLGKIRRRNEVLAWAPPGRHGHAASGHKEERQTMDSAQTKTHDQTTPRSHGVDRTRGKTSSEVEIQRWNSTPVVERGSDRKRDRGHNDQIPRGYREEGQAGREDSSLTHKPEPSGVQNHVICKVDHRQGIQKAHQNCGMPIQRGGTGLRVHTLRGHSVAEKVCGERRA